jgi:hypothetical protein
VKKTRCPRMSARARELAKKTVPEEVRARRGRGSERSRAQAVAVGLSRARERAELERALVTAREYL